MIGMLIVGSYSIIDTIFIGHSSGKLGLASVAVTWPLVMLFEAIGDMFGTGAVSYSTILIFGSPACMLMMAVSSVIRNDGRPVLSMWLTIIGLLLNIVLDYIFIFTLNGGIIGAAYATVVSQAFFALPLCLFTLPLWFGLDGVWLSMPLSRVILFAYVCYLWFAPHHKK